MSTPTPNRPSPTTIHHLSLSSLPSHKTSPLSPEYQSEGKTAPDAGMPTEREGRGEVKTHGSALPAEEGEGEGDAKLHFVGTATCILEWQGVRIMTDPNFLHAGDHVHLGPGVTGTRLTNPSLDLEELPGIDVVVLSHFHADHFDQLVQQKLRKDLPIVTTKHAEEELKTEELGFTAIYGMDVWQSTLIDIKDSPLSKSNNESGAGKVPVIRVTATPGKHIAGVIGAINDALLHAIPPTNGHILELGFKSSGDGASDEIDVGYRIYISGDTLMVDELKEIPERYPDVDLLLIHLGGTSIPSAKAPLLMVTMDALQGIQLVQLIAPKLTIPIHFDDYDVFASPRQDFEEEMEKAGLGGKALYLDRGDVFHFGVRQA